MTNKKEFSWLPIILLLLGISVGYTVILLQNDNVFASNNSCNTPGHVCANGDCNKK